MIAPPSHRKNGLNALDLLAREYVKFGVCLADGYVLAKRELDMRREYYRNKPAFKKGKTVDERKAKIRNDIAALFTKYLENAEVLKKDFRQYIDYPMLRTVILDDMHALTGLSRTTIRNRFSKGWDIEKMFSAISYVSTLYSDDFRKEVCEQVKGEYQIKCDTDGKNKTIRDRT